MTPQSTHTSGSCPACGSESCWGHSQLGVGGCIVLTLREQQRQAEPCITDRDCINDGWSQASGVEAKLHLTWVLLQVKSGTRLPSLRTPSELVSGYFGRAQERCEAGGYGAWTMPRYQKGEKCSEALQTALHDSPACCTSQCLQARENS